MNLFDHLGEDLTVMMIELDGYPDQDRVKKLIQALERCHTQACMAAQELRAMGAEQAAELSARAAA